MVRYLEAGLFADVSRDAISVSKSSGRIAINSISTNSVRSLKSFNNSSFDDSNCNNRIFNNSSFDDRSFSRGNLGRFDSFVRCVLFAH